MHMFKKALPPSHFSTSLDLSALCASYTAKCTGCFTFRGKLSALQDASRKCETACTLKGNTEMSAVQIFLTTCCIYSSTAQCTRVTNELKEL